MKQKQSIAPLVQPIQIQDDFSSDYSASDSDEGYVISRRKPSKQTPKHKTVTPNLQNDVAELKNIVESLVTAQAKQHKAIKKTARRSQRPSGTNIVMVPQPQPTSQATPQSKPVSMDYMESLRKSLWS